MVHAESSNFPSNLSKRDVYARLHSEAEALFQDQRSWVCNLANAASLLYHALRSLPSPSNQVNWAGFYTLDPSSRDDVDGTRLVLGPFMGKVACQSIQAGKGVCGAALARKETIRVDNVDEFPGHIACDADSTSEIVVPVVVHREVEDGRVDDVVVAVIDIDCGAQNGFDEVDEEELGTLAALIARSCDWSNGSISPLSD